MPRTFRGSINIDFTKADPGPYQALIAALIQADWKWVETSALIIETEDIGKVWQGIDVVARGAENAGQLSALTFHIQASDDFAGKPYAASAARKNALKNNQDRPFPKPKGK